MSILTANLKHLYQRRSLWFLYLYMGLILLFGIIITIIGSSHDFSHIAISYVSFLMVIVLIFFGMQIALMQIAIQNKAFTYCLPEYRQIPFQFILFAGLLASLVYSLVFVILFLLSYPASYTWQSPLVFLSALSGFLIAYWVGIGITYLTCNGIQWIIYVVIILLFSMLILDRFSDINYGILIIKFPFIFIAFGILSSCLVWRCMKTENFARKFINKPTFILSSPWNINKFSSYKMFVTPAKHWKKFIISPRIERFFLTHIRQNYYTNIRRYIWGSLYLRFGSLLSPSNLLKYLIWFVVILVPLYFLCYHEVMAGPELFLPPCIMILFLKPPLYSNMLIDGGRRERFAATLSLVVVTTLTITLICTLFAVMTHIPAEFMPDITLRGVTATFHPVDLKMVIIPFLIIPLLSILNIVFYRKPFFLITSFMLVFLIFMIILVFYAVPENKTTVVITINNQQYEATTSTIDKKTSLLYNPITIAILTAFNWILFAGVLKYVCSRRPLVGQSG